MMLIARLTNQSALMRMLSCEGAEREMIVARGAGTTVELMSPCETVNAASCADI